MGAVKRVYWPKQAKCLEMIDPRDRGKNAHFLSAFKTLGNA